MSRRHRRTTHCRTEFSSIFLTNAKRYNSLRFSLFLFHHKMSLWFHFSNTAFLSNCSNFFFCCNILATLNTLEKYGCDVILCATKIRMIFHHSMHFFRTHYFEFQSRRTMPYHLFTICVSITRTHTHVHSQRHHIGICGAMPICVSFPCTCAVRIGHPLFVLSYRGLCWIISILYSVHCARR